MLEARWLAPLPASGTSSLPEMLTIVFFLQHLLLLREIGQYLRQHPQALLLKLWTGSRRAIQASPLTVHSGPHPVTLKHVAALGLRSSSAEFTLHLHS